jgi:hypothetical protein
VVLDAYSKSYVPFHLMTAEFFKEVAAHLTGEGSVISNLIAGINGDASKLLAAEVRTMGTTFPNVYVFPVSGTDYQNPQNVIILATLQSSTLTKADFENLATRRTSFEPPTLKDDVANYFSIETSNAPVLTDNFAPVETLLNPLTGQSLTRDEVPSVDWHEVENVVVVILGVALVSMILVKKKVLRDYWHKSYQKGLGEASL